VQSVIHAIEIVEQAGHRGNLDDLSFIVVLAQTREHRIVDFVRIERELLRIRQRRLFFLIERPVLEIEQRFDLRFLRSVPRSLRSVRAVSVFASVDARDERRHELLGANGDRARVRDCVHVRHHRLEDLGPVRVDAEHVRHIAPLRSDPLKRLADIVSDLIFRELRQPRHRFSPKRKRPALPRGAIVSELMTIEVTLWSPSRSCPS
jgi:hypothetical protein